MNLIQQIEAEEIAKATSGAGKDIPEFRPGDTLRVGVKVVEGERSRVQNFDIRMGIQPVDDVSGIVCQIAREL